MPREVLTTHGVLRDVVRCSILSIDQERVQGTAGNRFTKKRNTSWAARARVICSTYPHCSLHDEDRNLAAFGSYPSDIKGYVPDSRSTDT